MTERWLTRSLSPLVQAVIEGYLRPMLADNWDRGSLYSFRAFSFPSDMPYEAITQPVLFITGERDQPLTRGAKKVRITPVRRYPVMGHHHDVTRVGLHATSLLKTDQTICMPVGVQLYIWWSC